MKSRGEHLATNAYMDRSRLVHRENLFVDITHVVETGIVVEILLIGEILVVVAVGHGRIFTVVLLQGQFQAALFDRETFVFIVVHGQFQIQIFLFEDQAFLVVDQPLARQV